MRPQSTTQATTVQIPSSSIHIHFYKSQTQTCTGYKTHKIVSVSSDTYVNEMAKALNLTNEDARWLTTALPPHMAELTTKALVIAGPIRRQAIIELEPAVKGLG